MHRTPRLDVMDFNSFRASSGNSDDVSGAYLQRGIPHTRQCALCSDNPNRGAGKGSTGRREGAETLSVNAVVSIRENVRCSFFNGDGEIGKKETRCATEEFCLVGCSGSLRCFAGEDQNRFLLRHRNGFHRREMTCVEALVDIIIEELGRPDVWNTFECSMQSKERCKIQLR
jgi:hypothetical protein